MAGLATCDDRDWRVTRRGGAPVCGLTLAVMLAAACGMRPASLSESLEARRLAGDLRWQFTTMVDAGNRAVMVGDDAAAGEAAREVESTAQDVQRNIDRLAPLRQSLRYSTETSQLEQFRTAFAEYHRARPRGPAAGRGEHEPSERGGAPVPKDCGNRPDPEVS